MTVLIILLALASTVRPTSLAAVCALLSTEFPRRLMTIYTAVGLAFTIALGLLVVWAFNGIHINSGSSHTQAIVQLIGGALLLAFAAGVRSGRVARRPGTGAKRPERWKQLLEQRMTFRTAALLGPATHLPGLFYLVALNLIVGEQPKVPKGLIQVLIYNVIWFAIPICALVVCFIEPQAARDGAGFIESWAKRHSRTIVVYAAAGLGAILVIRGLLTLLF